MIELSATDKEKLYTHGLKRSELEEIVASEDIAFYLDFFQLQGLTLIEKEGYYYPKQFFQSIEETLFCIVDIETNGSKHHKNQIIEIGAVLIKNGRIVDSFNSLLYARTLPESIAQLTGISLDDLLAAPSLKEGMHQFRAFVSDAVIVAHPLKFDYDFLSFSLENVDLGQMLNPALCNISLAERSFSSAKYGLQYLNKTLKLEEDFQQHRAYNDAVITKKIFLKALENLPKEVQTVQELFVFAKTAKKHPRAALIL